MRMHKERVMSVNGILCNVIMDKGPGRDSFDIVPFLPRKLQELGFGDLSGIWRAAKELMDDVDGAVRMLDGANWVMNSAMEKVGSQAA